MELLQKWVPSLRQLLLSPDSHSKHDADTPGLEDPSPSLTSQLTAAMTDERQQIGQNPERCRPVTLSAASVPSTRLVSAMGNVVLKTQKNKSVPFLNIY